MRVAILSCLFACGVLAGCGEGPGAGTQQTPAQTNAISSEPGVITAPVDYLGAVAKAQQSAVKTVDLASINQAVRLFQVEKGRLPGSLNELVEEQFLARIPPVPHGNRLSYDPATGQTKVVKQ